MTDRAEFIELLPYQRRFILDPSPLVTLVKSRRVGGSFAVCYRGALRMMGLEVGPEGLRVSGSPPANQALLSAGEEQAQQLLIELYERIEELARVCPIREAWPAGEPLKRSFFLRNGTKAVAHSDSPRSARGQGADVILDEFAWCQDPDRIWAATEPVAARSLKYPEGFRVSVVTTPGSTGGLPHKLCVADGETYIQASRHEVSIHQAVREGFPDPTRPLEERLQFIEESRERVGSPEIFAEEYECAWISAAAMYLPFEMLDAVTYRPADLPREEECYRYVGVDIGRKVHLTAICPILRRKQGDPRMWALPPVVLKQADFETQAKAIAEQLQLGAMHILIDQTTYGHAFVEGLRKTLGHRIEGISLMPQTQTDLVMQLRHRIETGKLFIPKDPELRRDLGSLRREINDSGRVRFLAQEKRGHADRAFALAIAVESAGTYASGVAAKSSRRRDVTSLKGYY